MKDQTLQKYQRAELFDFISKTKMLHSDFAWRETESIYLGTTKVSELVHIPTGYFFLCDFNSDGSLFSRYSPGVETKTDFQSSERWSQRRYLFLQWLQSLEREIETIDPWEMVADASNVIKAATDSDNSRFSQNEQNYIAAGIAEIKDYLTTVHDIKADVVAPPLEYLEHASTRLGRKDWKNILIAIMFNIMIDAYLPAETTREIFRFVGATLHTLLQQQGYLP